MTTFAPSLPSVPSMSPPVSRRAKAFGLALLITAGAFGIGLIIAESPLLAVFVAAGVVAFLVSLARPSSATYVVIAILYSNAAAVAARSHGVPDFIAVAFPLLLALPLADHLLLRRKPVVITAALPFLFGYMLVQVLSTIGARDVSDTADGLIGFLIGGFGLYFVITNVIRTYASLRTAIWVVLVAAAAVGVLSTIQAVTGQYNNDFGGFATVDLPGRDNAEQLSASLDATVRAEGPIGETNRFAQVMVVLLPIGVMLAIGEKRRLYRSLALLLTLLILAGMATTFSRGAALGLTVVLVVATFLGYLRVRHLVGLGLVLALLLLAFPTYGQRLLDLQGLLNLDQKRAVAEQPDAQVVGDTGNLRGRATSTLAALYVWSDHPVFGVGRGQFRQYYEEYAGEVADTGLSSRVDFGATRQAHNLYTSVAAETGTFGLVLFLAVFIVTMRRLLGARRWWHASRPDVAHLAVGFFLAIVAYLVSGIALHLSYERYLWFLLALAGVTAHLALKGDPNRDFEVVVAGAAPAGSP